MRIYILGSGGIGGYFGGLLAYAGQDVTFVARGEHFNVLRDKGLTVKSVVGDFEVKPVKTIENISEITTPDLVIFSVKTYHTNEVAAQLASVINPNTVIITFQNGVDNDNQIKNHIKNTQVFPGVAYVISTKLKPGVIFQTGGLRKLIFGDRDNPANPKLKEIEQLIKSNGVDATLSNNITRDLWKKFMFIVAFSGMTSICRSPISKVLGNPITKSLYERCVQEAITVAKAMNVTLEDKAFEAIMGISERTAPDSKSSLLVDIENNRPNEIETLNGILVNYAKQLGIDTPINELIYGAVKLIGENT